MKSNKQGAATAVDTARRVFTGWLCGNGLLTLAGCGGGGSEAFPSSMPLITQAPQSASVIAGQTFILTVEASGSNLSYQWKRNGVAVNGATGKSLQLTVAGADSGAAYTVVVSNPAGQVESTSAVLTLKAGGSITLLAGGLGAGASAQPGEVDGEGAQARFANMGPSCVDQGGNFYVIDLVAKTLRKVSPTGSTSTLFTDFPSDGGLAVDAQGCFYGVRNRAIIKVTPTGVQQVWAGQPGLLGFADGPGATASFARPMGLTFDAQGNLLVGDSPDQQIIGLSVYITYTYGSTIRKITPAGFVSTVAGVAGRTFLDLNFWSNTPFPNREVTFIRPQALATDPTGKVWVLDITGVRRIDAEGSTPVWLTYGHFTAFTSLAYAVGSAGDVYVGRGHVISILSADGTETVVAGVDSADHEGVQLGALPGGLGPVASLACGAANVFYACSENSVLQIQLA